MKKSIGILSVVLIALGSNSCKVEQSKNDPVLLTVAGNRIAKSEFEKIYKKNNTKENATDKRSVQDYLDLYINYKLKVREAEEMKLDTSRAFREELEGYRKQLAQPYLTDKVVSDNLLKEAYDRSKKDIRASHILIKVSPDALPKDTLAAYTRALRIRESILKGKDFGTMAADSSSDPSAKDNKGDLGYFTSLQMVYTFENAAYNAKIGDVSMPVRTRFGYHLIKVLDSRPAQGEIHVEHIMIKSPKGGTAEDSLKAKVKIDEIYGRIKKGENFEDLARQFSDDVNSGRSGGVLPWFVTGRMVIDFEKAAFSLKKDGDISEPVKSSFGWHIIKRLEKKDLPTFEAMQPELKSKVAKDSRAEISKYSLIRNVKKENGFKEYGKAKDEVISKLDSSFLEGSWSLEKAKNLEKPVFKIGEKEYTQQSLAKYIAEHQGRKRGTTAKAQGEMLYGQFVNESCIAFEESRLDQKYPDFKSLMQEYRDGILLFELTDRKVWSKAVKDTSGLKGFYNKNKDHYLWSDRLDASIYSCQSAEIADKVREMVKKGVSSDSILAAVNKDSQLNLSIKEGKYALGDNEIIDSVKWTKGMSENMKKKNSLVFVNVKNKLGPEPKTLDEAKGIVTAEYQAYLEKEWIDSLRKKYPVVVYNEVLASVSK